MITTTAAGRTWHYSHNLGRQTAEHNQSKFGRTGGYCFPMDVAAAGNDILFVLSRGYGFENVARGFDIYLRIGKTTIDEDHIGDFARGGFTWPVGIAISKSDGSVFASDEYECTISAFDPDGIQTFPEYDPDGEYFERWGTKGSEPGMLNGPAGIAFDANDDLYVVDSLNNRVQAFTRTGEFLKTWGRPGVSEGEFNRPWGITIDREGAVYVADWGNHRVQKFGPDGEYLMTFGSQNGSASSLTHPSGVAVDSDGDVYVTDWGNGRVQIYEPDGEALAALYGDMRELSKGGRVRPGARPGEPQAAQPQRRADKVPQQVLQAGRHRHRRARPHLRDRRVEQARGVPEGPRLPGAAAVGFGFLSEEDRVRGLQAGTVCDCDGHTGAVIP